MDVTLQIDPEDATRLARIFGVDPGNDPAGAVGGELAGLAKAALAEYMLYITGERAPAGIRDLRELRLRLIAEHLPGGLPTDTQVAQLFHLTPAQARNLIAGARARYPDDFETSVTAAAKKALTESDKGDDGAARITASNSLVTFLRDIISASSQALLPIKVADATNRYDLTPDAVEVVCARVGLDIGEVKGLA